MSSTSSQPCLNWRDQWSNGKCPYCDGLFKGSQGVRVHISNAHPQQSQALKLSKRIARATRKTGRNSIIIPQPSSAPLPPSGTPTNPVTDRDDNSDGTAHALPDVSPWEAVFTDLSERPFTEDITTEFNNQVHKCSQFLCDAIQLVKGPKHPNTKFYEARRAGRARRPRPGYQRASNPIRRNRRRRDAARERYQYDLVQYQYYNTRRQAVRTVMNSKDHASCPVPIHDVEQHFQTTLEKPNDHVRDVYDTIHADEDVQDTITEDEVSCALKGMAVDTSPGPDRVLLRVVKLLKCEKLLSLIATIMYRRTIVPSHFQQGRTVLLSKDGDPDLLKNWRPITIFSVLRRVIERVLDSRLRSKIQFSTSQRGFVSVPGTHINSSIVDGVMRSAKRRKDKCVIVFLDVSKAFDNIGHAHVRRTLGALPLPDKLRDLICLLCEENTTNIRVGTHSTRRIRVKRGVPQGAPLSPALFNLCIDFILKELSDESVAQEYGYSLVDGLPPITTLAFADDIVILAKDEESARRLVEIATKGLQSIGLQINSSKSQAVVFSDGQMVHHPSGLPLLTGETIPTLQPGDRVRYLGVDFEQEIVFDEVQALHHLKENVDRLTCSCLLHPDQKLNILNTYVWPALVYPLQSAPLYKISKGFLNDVDMLLRGAVKQFCSLPMDTPNAMMYTSQKYRGLGVIRASWEAYLQHINISRRLALSDDPYLHESRDVQAEENLCLQKLDLSDPTTGDPDEEPTAHPSPVALSSVRDLRLLLRDREYSTWCALPSRGLGAEVFQETPACNKWVRVRTGLSSSEWTNALKMSSNNCNIRSNPRTASSTLHCRHCGEFESLAHVLGKCPRGELLRNRRHHRVCDTIAEQLRQQGCTVFREDHASTENLGSRFCDLVVLDSRDDIQRGYILDPTIRLEKSVEQAADVDEEKRAIYEPTLPTYRSRFPDVGHWRVVGLLFGARGVVPRHTWDVLTRDLLLPKKLIPELSLTILKDSLGILHNHLYSRDQA